MAGSELIPVDNGIHVDKYSVDDLLDRVDYSFPGYTPSADAFAFMNFMRLVFGEEPENDNSLAHYFLIDVIFKHVDPWAYYGFQSDIARDNYIAIMCHREFSKSVLLGSILTLYMAYYGYLPGFGKVNFGGYVGNSVRGGVRQNMQTIAGVYKDSDYLQDKFEFTHFTDSAVKFVRHPRKNKDGTIDKRDRKESKRTFVVEGYGAQAGPRGSRDGLVRPQFFIIDDVIKNAADSRSPIILDKISKMIEEDIGYALSTSGCFCLYIGTPFNLRDPLMKSLVDGTWTPVVFPVAEKINLSITKEEFKGSWEDRHSYEKVMIKYRTAMYKGFGPAFMQEMMLRVASEEDRMIRDDMINWFDRENILLKGYAYNWYITTDFTTTGKKSSDFSSMMVWAVSEQGDHMLVDLVIQKFELADQYDKLFELVRKYKKRKGYLEVGIETSGQQGTHIFAIKELMTKHNEYFKIAEQIGTKKEGISRSVAQGNKFEYFMLSVPLFSNSKMWFARELKETPDMQELLAELSYVTHEGFGAAADDGLDCISQLSQMKIIIPSDGAEAYLMAPNPDTGIYEIDDDDEDVGDGGSVIF